MASAKKTCLRLGLLNIRSINTGQDELSATLLNYSPDIVALNETWLKPGEEDAAPVIPSYKFLHKARQGKKGGGVGFYVRQGIITKLQKHPTSSLEQLWLKVQFQSTSLAVGTAYRPESVGVQEALDALSESINSMARCDLTCVLGDFNIDMASPNTPKAQELKHFCHQHNLEQLVKEPTRITQHSETILDLVLTDNSSKCRNVEIIHNYCLSDHALVIVDVDVRKNKIKKELKYKRTLHNINFDYFNADLNHLPWNSIGELQDVNEMVETFNKYILLLFDTHAPTRKIICRDKPKPWITDMLRFMMKLRDDALQKALKTKKESAKEYYRNLRNLVTATIERERRAYFNSFINANLKNPTVLWRNIKNTTNVNKIKPSTIPDHLNDPDRINDHFLNLPPCPETNFNTKSMNLVDISEHDELNLKPVSEEEVKNIIYNIKTKAAGHDDLSIDMIKLTLEVTLPIITKMVNKSIETNTFPSSWKKALVKPIPKKNTVLELKDLRPISILPVLSKVLEKVVLVQVLKYLEKINIIPKFQSGFRKAHGTETALLQVTDDLTEASDMGLSTIMVLLDYSRAFDCLEPKLLLAKLEHYRFSKNTCDWFHSFLNDREQSVLTERGDGLKRCSTAKPIQRGVPQGSLLSPTLFTIFTADLPAQIKHCKYHLYADDTQLYYSFDSKNTHEAAVRINEDLFNVYTWSQKNSLLLNPNKSQMVFFGTKKQVKSATDLETQITINDVAIERVTCARNLGLMMDEEQKYAEHVGNKIKTALFKLKTLYKIRPYIKEELRILLCESLILSQLSYCSTVYGPRLNNSTVRAIQRVQNASVRFCFHVPKRECITPYLNRKGILNMEARRELQYACTVHRVIWSKNPDYLFEKLAWKRDFPHASRHVMSNLIKIPKHKSARYEGCFKFAAARIWNDLPPPLREKMSTDSFKRQYKKALLKRQLDTENIKHSYWKHLSLKGYL